MQDQYSVFNRPIFKLFGMKCILAGTELNAWPANFVNMGLVSKYIGYKLHRQLLELFPVLAASVTCAILSYICGFFLHLDMYSDGAVKLAIYVVLYLGWSFLFRPGAYTRGLYLI